MDRITPMTDLAPVVAEYEPLYGALQGVVRDCLHGGPGSCTNVWWPHVLDVMRRLVGPTRDPRLRHESDDVEELLRSERAYEHCYLDLFDWLPPCRHKGSCFGGWPKVSAASQRNPVVVWPGKDDGDGGGRCRRG